MTNSKARRSRVNSLDHVLHVVRDGKLTYCGRPIAKVNVVLGVLTESECCRTCKRAHELAMFMVSIRVEIAEAIERSKSHNEIVTIRGDTAHTRVLRDECEDCALDDYSDFDNVCHEFWGKDIDGNEWRVHVRMAS